MRETRTIWIAVGLVICSVSGLACLSLWFHTRTWKPVDQPISLSAGTRFTTDLSINVEAQYTIDINSGNQIELEKLQCLMGSKFSSMSCRTPPVLRARWSVDGNGATQEGTSDDTMGYGGFGPSGDVWREIGRFRGTKGARYRISVDVLADGGVLSVTHPHLVVSVMDSSYESTLIMKNAICVLCGIIGLVGGVLIVRRLAHPLSQ